ncbi:MAG TPA: winged helix-turn-helix domain-containing protein [Phycisphaerae bacterium]|nr:winged helix-turn-helix domain-containing protein [Phycisphaerae bacterium]HQL76137.1 winged helix-turn-helix domain-containing protein [Phycisphaerae bacterium]
MINALARRTDSPTSHQAAEEVEASGRAASQRHLCLIEVWKTPGKTAAEIAVAAGLERHVPSRRLPELRKAGQIVNGPERLCTVTGNLSMTWLPAREVKS